MARATGRVAVADRYDAMIPKLKESYHAAFFDPIGQIYGDGTPTAFGAALWLGVTPPDMLPAVARNFLKQLSFEFVEEAMDGTAVLEKSREFNGDFGLVISDWNMEPMTRIQLLREVRGDDELKQIPKEAGVSNYIVKPFNAETLKSKMESTLGEF